MFDSPRYEVAQTAAKQASRVLLSYFRKDFSVQAKSSYNLVTQADFESETEITRIIRRSFADDAILGEESNSADLTAEHLWIVDPLDGTNNFVHGLDHFAVSIAYYHQGIAQLGVVVKPTTDEWFVCCRDQGAFWNSRPARVSDAVRLNETLVGVGFYYDRGRQMRNTLQAMGNLFEKEIRGIRRMGTASLDLCMVGIGIFGAYFEFELSPWDFAAGRLFVEEAGGRVTNCLGEGLVVGNSSILASNGHLHQAMTESVKPFMANSE